MKFSIGLAKLSLLIFLFIFSISLIFLFSFQKEEVKAQTNKWNVNFVDYPSLSHVCFEIDIENLQDKPDDFPFKVILNNTNINISKTTTSLQEWKSEEVNITDYTTECYPYNITNETTGNITTISNCTIYESGWHLEERWNWEDRKLTFTERDTEKVELRNQFEEIHIKKGETKKFKVCYWFNEVPIRPDGWGSYGFMYLDVKEQLFYDFSTSSWWNSSWNYRRNITINNTQNSNTLTDYQVLVNITYDSDMVSDFSDLRFTWYNSSDSTETEIGYWFESKVDSSWVYTWIKVKEIPASSTATIYVYYGNTTPVSSKSNGENTFNFFDDFLGTELNYSHWGTKLVGYGLECSYSVSNSYLNVTCEGDASSAAKSFVYQNATNWGNTILYAQRRKSNITDYTDNTDWTGLNLCLDSSGNAVCGNSDWGIMYYWRHNGRLDVLNGTNEIVGNVLHDSEFEVAEFRELTTSTFKILAKNSTYTFTNTTDLETPLPSTNYFAMSFYAGVNDKTITLVDWYLVRKYSDPEPNYSIGSEETRPEATSIRLWLNNQEDNITITYGTSLNATAQINVTGLFVELYKNDTLIANDTTTVFNITIWEAGYHEIKAYYPGNATYQSSEKIYYQSSEKIYYANITKAPTEINLTLNGTDGDKSYTINDVANFTVVLNVSGKTVKLYSNYTGWVLQSGLTPLMNYTTLTTTGNWWNLTGYFEGDENYTSSFETHYFNVTPFFYTKEVSETLNIAEVFESITSVERKLAVLPTLTDLTEKIIYVTKTISQLPAISDVVIKIISPYMSIQTIYVKDYEIKIHDFTDLIDNWAYYNIISVKPPTELSPSGETEFTSEAYTNISSSDNTYYTTTSTTEYPYHRFVFTLDRPKAYINEINVSWEGNTYADRTIYLYGWNCTAGEWYWLDYKTVGTAEDFILSSLVDIDDFVCDQKIYIMVQDPQLDLNGILAKN